MKYAVISSLDIAKCPTHNLSASHWIDGHHIDECHTEPREKVKQYAEAQALQVAQQLEQLRKNKARNIERYTKWIRRQKP